MDPLFFDCYSPKQLAPKKRKQKKRKLTKIKPAPPAPATINKINIVIRQDKHDEHRKLTTVEKEPEVTVEEEPPSVVVEEKPPVQVLVPPPPEIVEQAAARPRPMVLPAEPLFDKDELLKLLQEAAAATMPEPEPETKPPPPPPAAKRPPASWRVQFMKDQLGFLKTSLQQNKSDCLTKTPGLSVEKRDYMEERFRELFSDAKGELIKFTKTHSDEIPTNAEIDNLHNTLSAQLLGGCKLINAEIEKIGETK